MLIVAGIGTGVGKTLVSAILTHLLGGAYWKPISCGTPCDAAIIKNLLLPSHTIYPPAYHFKAPLSPHLAAALEGREIQLEKIIPPKTSSPLIVETVGGIYTPLRSDTQALSFFQRLSAHWVLVSSHYLGSLNHTLLTLHALAAHKIPLKGILFNGEEDPENEALLQEAAGVPCLGSVRPESLINRARIEEYAKAWKHHF